MAIFNSYVSLPEGIYCNWCIIGLLSLTHLWMPIPQAMTEWTEWKTLHHFDHPEINLHLVGGLEHVFFHKIWVSYNDLTATSLESWLVRENIPK